jgi:hypothetical protein
MLMSRAVLVARARTSPDDDADESGRGNYLIFGLLPCRRSATFTVRGWRDS